MATSTKRSGGPSREECPLRSGLGVLGRGLTRTGGGGRQRTGGPLYLPRGPPLFFYFSSRNEQPQDFISRHPPSYPLYIFILCNKYKKKAGRRQGRGTHPYIGMDPQKEKRTPGLKKREGGAPTQKKG